MPDRIKPARYVPAPPIPHPERLTVRAAKPARRRVPRLIRAILRHLIASVRACFIGPVRPIRPVRSVHKRTHRNRGN